MHGLLQLEWTFRIQTQRNRARIAQQTRALWRDIASYAKHEVEGIQTDDVSTRCFESVGVSDRIADRVLRSEMLDSGARQDHAPIVLELAWGR